MEALLGNQPISLILDDTSASGEFVILLRLKSAMSRGERVVLASTNSSLERYKACMKKLLTHLQPFLDSSLLVFIDLCRLLPPTSPLSSSLDLKTAYTCIHSAIKSDQKTTLIIDDLSSLRSLTIGGSTGLKAIDWQKFVHLICCLGTQERSLVLLAHSDIEEDGPWLMQLEHRANVTSRVSSLGFKLADVDGKVVVRQRDASPTASSRWGGAQSMVMSHDLPVEASVTLFFHSSDTTTGVKWLSNGIDSTF
jgi:hypothetical protein